MNTEHARCYSCVAVAQAIGSLTQDKQLEAAMGVWVEAAVHREMVISRTCEELNGTVCGHRLCTKSKQVNKASRGCCRWESQWTLSLHGRAALMHTGGCSSRSGADS